MSKVYLIAEVAQAHDGSLGQALSYIKAAAFAGASAVKFQVHLAEEESSAEDRFRVNNFPQDKTRYDYWKRVSFTESQWKMLIDYSRELNIDFISSVFSVRAFEMMAGLGQNIWKIASGEVHDPLLVDTLLNSRQRVIFSTGLSTWPEINSMITRCQGRGLEFSVLKCTSEYPTSENELELDLITKLKHDYPSVSVGFSDHSGSIYPSLAAIAKGAEVVEIHVAFSKDQFGPDTIASVTFEELRTLAEMKDLFFKICHIKTDITARDKRILSSPNRKLFTKSVYYRNSLARGDSISEKDLAFLKPNTGIPAVSYKDFLGKTLCRDVIAGSQLRADDFL